jgi:hypothetical protein
MQTQRCWQACAIGWTLAVIVLACGLTACGTPTPTEPTPVASSQAGSESGAAAVSSGTVEEDEPGDSDITEDTPEGPEEGEQVGAARAVCSVGTVVGQINGTPTTRPGGTVVLQVGLQSNAGLGNWGPHVGPVKLYTLSNGVWKYRTTGSAAAGVARFTRRIASTAKRGYIRYRFLYPGTWMYCSSQGRGQVYVQ